VDGFSLAGSGAIAPLTPSPRIQGLVVSRHGVELQGPPRFPGGFLSFPALRLCLANAGAHFSPRSGCTEEDPDDGALFPERQRR
jgi:hypothetical protein